MPRSSGSDGLNLSAHDIRPSSIHRMRPSIHVGCDERGGNSSTVPQTTFSRKKFVSSFGFSMIRRKIHVSPSTSADNAIGTQFLGRLMEEEPWTQDGVEIYYHNKSGSPSFPLEKNIEKLPLE